MLFAKEGDDLAITGSRCLPTENDANQNIMTKSVLPAVWQTKLNKYSEPVNKYYISFGASFVIERAKSEVKSRYLDFV